MSELQLHEGPGSFVFSDIAAPTGALRVFFFCPKPAAGDARIVVAMHGFDRAASDFRDVLVSQAGRTGQIILVPEFDAAQFPDAYAYNYGNVRREPSSEAAPIGRPSDYSVIQRALSTCCATSHSPRVLPSMRE